MSILIDTDMRFRNYYFDKCASPSDINEHLPILYELAQQCEHVTEFGVRYGISTTAFLYAATKRHGPTVRCYDIVIEEPIRALFNLARSCGAHDVGMLQGDSLKINIEPTDMLFIDTNHTYEHLTAELERHHTKVSKYIVMHDTKSMGLGAWDTEPQGLLSALLHFLIKYPEWVVHYHTVANNGLTAIRRA